MIKQFREIKAKHPQALLLFRCGDFYEAYEEDAEECARILGITLTKKSEQDIKIAGFPHHALDTYLPKIIRAGKRVAICDQLEIPEPTKKMANQVIDNSTKSEDKIMANKLQAADLIGKVITIVGTEKYYKVLGVDGEKLNTEFHNTKGTPLKVPLNMTMVNDMVEKGTWSVGEKPLSNSAEGESEPTADVKVEEIEVVAPTIASPLPASPEGESKKRKTKAKPNNGQSSTVNGQSSMVNGQYVFETYTNKKNKTCARIVGFGEGDLVYIAGNDLHGSASYKKDEQGNKVLYLAFGPRYVSAAEAICKVLNSDKSDEEKLAACKQIVSDTSEAIAEKNEENKQKRNEYLARRNSGEQGATAVQQPTEGLYTYEHVESVVRKAFGALADVLKQDVAEMEPLIEVSLSNLKKAA